MYPSYVSFAKLYRSGVFYTIFYCFCHSILSIFFYILNFQWNILDLQNFSFYTFLEDICSAAVEPKKEDMMIFRRSMTCVLAVCLACATPAWAADTSQSTEGDTAQIQTEAGQEAEAASDDAIRYLDYEWETPEDEIREELITPAMKEGDDYRFQQGLDLGPVGDITPEWNVDQICLPEQEVAGATADEYFVFSDGKLECGIHGFDSGKTAELYQKYCKVYGDPVSYLTDSSNEEMFCAVWMDSNQNIIAFDGRVSWAPSVYYLASGSILNYVLESKVQDTFGISMIQALGLNVPELEIESESEDVSGI